MLPLPPLSRCVNTKIEKKIGFVFPRKKLHPKMVKRSDKTNTGEGGKGKKGRTVSDDAGGKSLSEKSKSVSGQCVGENSTGVKSSVIRNSEHI